jgi:hypothetical protein
LFQWVDDRRVLYGEEEAEFRVAVDMTKGDEEGATVRASRLEEEGSGLSEYRGEDWRVFLRSV